MKNNYNLKLVVFLLLSIIANSTLLAQTDLVRWNSTSAPTPQVANITATQINLNGGVTMSNAAYSGFRINNLHNGSNSNINYSKYLAFSVTPNSNYKIALSQFKLVYNSPNNNNGPTKLQVRYSTNASFPSNGTLLGSEQTLTQGSNQNLTLNFPAGYSTNQTIYLRLYAFGATSIYYTDFFLRNTLYNSNTQGPTLTGSVSLAVPVPTNDNAVTAQNIPVNIDILNNDSYSTLSAITITQQPTNGQNITVNSLTDVTYTPNNNYLGSDSFKYTITDQNGTSSEATVNITISVPTAPTAVADSFTVPTGQTTNLNVLSNDTSGSGAFDDVVITTNPTNGSITVNPNNTVAYTPSGNYNGADSFQYNVTNIHSLTSNTVTVTLDVTCNCTHTISGNSITVNSGETYCLTSGSWSGGVAMNGGTICISQGATFSASYTSGAFSGTVINRGTITAFPLDNNNTHSVKIINKGTFTSAYLQEFEGRIENYGTFTITGGFETVTGSTIENYGDLFPKTISFYGTVVNNYDGAEFKTTSGVNVYSGSWDNRLGGEVFFNGSNVNFTGNLDNSGYWEFERISSLSSTINNYKHMKVFNQASNISSTTYLTNDDLLEFIDVPDIQYNGPMLTNNGTLTVTHNSAGNFKMNQAINQVFNNGKIEVSGQFEQNAVGSKLVNNCHIVCETYFLGNGDTTNNGLIYANGTGNNDGVKIQGAASKFYNSKTGFLRGNNFTNSGEIKGYGSFYFTGTTNNNSAGSIIGDSANEQILFFDNTQTGNNIFDQPGATATNVLRPSSMTPLDASSYNCTAPPSVAGSPPQTDEVDLDACLSNNVTFDIDNYVTPAPPVGGDPFVVSKTSLKLFEFNNNTNPTNNTTNLIITGKGTFSANTTTGIITFTPDPAFTGGMVAEAEYKISNKRSGDPVTYPSPKTKITITSINLPNAVDDSATTTENNSTNIDVLDNDVIGDNPFSITSANQPANGSAVINNNGTPGDASDDTIDYTPNQNFSGTDTFTYVISDGICGSDTATVTVDVQQNNSDFEAAMITQIYHKGTTDRWIEITNTKTTNTIPANKLYLALFKNKTGDQTSVIPTATLLISSSIIAGESVLIKKASSTLTNITGTIIANAAITNFDGQNDILIVTKTTDNTAWANRFDVVTNVPNNTSMVRSDEVLTANNTFTQSEWVNFIDDNLNPYRDLSNNGPERHPHDPLISEIANSNTDANTLLGLHRMKKTTRTSGAWNNGFPDRSRFVEIDQDYNHTGSRLSARKLTVNTAKKLAVTDSLLVVTNNVVLNGEIRLIDASGKSKAQFIQTHTGTDLVTGSGKLLIDQNSAVPSKYRYNYMSSPVKTSAGSSNYTVASVFKDGTTATNYTGDVDVDIAKNIDFVSGYDGSIADPIKLAEYWIYTYATNGGTRAGWVNKSSTDSIPNTDGFIFKGPGRVQNYTFLGVPKDGINNTTIGGSESYLVGNPFASALSVKKFIEDNTNSITGTLYFWQHVNEADNTSTATSGHNFAGYIGGYATRNIVMGVAANQSTNANTNANNGTSGALGSGYLVPEPYIAVGQGFFVAGDTNGGTITFNNSQREFIAEEGTNTSIFFKQNTSKKTKKTATTSPIIKLGLDYKNEKGLDFHRQIGVSFNANNTFGIEKGYDSELYDLGTTDMYWKMPSNSSKFVIAGVPEITDYLEVPLEIVMNYTGEVVLQIDEMKGIDRAVYLKDRLTDKDYLLNNNKVSISLTEGLHSYRFYLSFMPSKALGIDDVNQLTNMNVYFDASNKELVINNTSDKLIKEVQLYTILGQKIQSWKKIRGNTESRLKTIKTPTNFYIVKINTNQGSFSKKIIIE